MNIQITVSIPQLDALTSAILAHAGSHAPVSGSSCLPPEIVERAHELGCITFPGLQPVRLSPPEEITPIQPLPPPQPENPAAQEDSSFKAMKDRWLALKGRHPSLPDAPAMKKVVKDSVGAPSLADCSDEQRVTFLPVLKRMEEEVKTAKS